MNFGVGTWKIKVRIQNLHFQDTMCVSFQLKRKTLTFLAQIYPKRKLRFEIQKTNVGIRISIFEIPCVPIFRQNGQLWIFGPKFAQKWILGSEFQKSKSGFGISILEILCVPIFRQNGQLWIFGPKFAQKWILGSEFQKSKSGFRINTSNIPCVLIFSQNGQLLIFWPKFGEIAPGWSWMEVYGAGWRWVHGLVIPI